MKDKMKHRIVIKMLDFSTFTFFNAFYEEVEIGGLKFIVVCSEHYDHHIYPADEVVSIDTRSNNPYHEGGEDSEFIKESRKVREERRDMLDSLANK